jgi:hypothetical protein
MLAVMPATLSGCDTIRGWMGYEVSPPPIVEKHLAPCMQPHRGSPHRNCAGDRTIYTPRPASERQQF